MQKQIASFDYYKDELHPDCVKLFNIGIQFIEKEFKTPIRCEIKLNKQNAKAELNLLDIAPQDWYYKDIELRELISHKLITHFKICLDNY